MADYSYGEKQHTDPTLRYALLAATLIVVSLQANAQTLVASTDSLRSPLVAEEWVAASPVPIVYPFKDGDLGSSSVVEVSVGQNPVQIALAVERGEALVWSRGSGTIDIVNLESHSVVTSIPLSVLPSKILISNDESKLYVIGFAGGPVSPDQCGITFVDGSLPNKIQVIDVETREVILEVAIPVGAREAVLSSDDRYLFVVINDGRVVEVDTETGIVVSESHVCDDLKCDQNRTQANTVSEARGLLYVGVYLDFGEQSTRSGFVSYDTGSGEWSEIVGPDSTFIHGSAKSRSAPDESIVFVELSDGERNGIFYPAGIALIDTDTNEIFGYLDYPLRISEALDLRDGRRVLLLDDGLFGEGKSVIYDYIDEKIDRTISQLGGVSGVVSERDSDVIYHLRWGTRSGHIRSSRARPFDVSAYSLSNSNFNTLAATINSFDCSSSRSIVTTPDGRFVVASNSWANSIFVFDFGRITNVLDTPPTRETFVRAFPTPAVDRVTIEYSLLSVSPVEMRLFDVAGRMIRMLDSLPYSGRISVETSDLPAGHYIYRLNSGSLVETGRLVIMK